MKQKSLFIIFKGLSRKHLKPTFLVGGSPTIKHCLEPHLTIYSPKNVQLPSLQVNQTPHETPSS